MELGQLLLQLQQQLAKGARLRAVERGGFGKLALVIKNALHGDAKVVKVELASAPCAFAIERGWRGGREVGEGLGNFSDTGSGIAAHVQA